MNRFKVKPFLYFEFAGSMRMFREPRKDLTKTNSRFMYMQLTDNVRMGCSMNGDVKLISPWLIPSCLLVGDTRLRIGKRISYTCNCSEGLIATPGSGGVPSGLLRLLTSALPGGCCAMGGGNKKANIGVFFPCMQSIGSREPPVKLFLMAAS